MQMQLKGGPKVLCVAMTGVIQAQETLKAHECFLSLSFASSFIQVHKIRLLTIYTEMIAPNCGNVCAGSRCPRTENCKFWWTTNKHGPTAEYPDPCPADKPASALELVSTHNLVPLVLYLLPLLVPAYLEHRTCFEFLYKVPVVM